MKILAIDIGGTAIKYGIVRDIQRAAFALVLGGDGETAAVHARL